MMFVLSAATITTALPVDGDLVFCRRLRFAMSSPRSRLAVDGPARATGYGQPEASAALRARSSPSRAPPSTVTMDGRRRVLIVDGLEAGAALRCWRSAGANWAIKGRCGRKRWSGAAKKRRARIGGTRRWITKRAVS